MQLTKSGAKEARTGLAKSCPGIEPLLDELFPKNEVLYSVRLKENGKAELVLAGGKWVCFKYMGFWVPSLRVLQKC